MDYNAIFSHEFSGVGDLKWSDALFQYREVILEYSTSTSRFQFVQLDGVSDMSACNIV